MLERVRDRTKLEAILSRLSPEERQVISPWINLDYQTGLLNESTFHDELNRQVHRSSHHEEKLGVAILDIDDFGEYQDKHPEGHLGGDKALVVLADTIRRRVNDFDVVGRLHGDEFAIIYLDSDANGALEASNRILRAIPQGYPTLSVGIAEYAKGMTASELIQKADRAVYRAKQKGKNRCEIYSD